LKVQWPALYARTSLCPRALASLAKGHAIRVARYRKDLPFLSFPVKRVKTNVLHGYPLPCSNANLPSPSDVAHLTVYDYVAGDFMWVLAAHPAKTFTFSERIGRRS